MPAPTYKTDQKELPYLELWMRQSELFWSRIQTGITLHGAGLTGAFLVLSEGYHELAILINISASLLSIVLIRIMKRDADLMATFAANLPTFDFHQVIKKGKKHVGRKNGYYAIRILAFIQLGMGIGIVPFLF
jgi:hypothetical protein